MRLMSAKRIIPCLDVKVGRVVKGTKFINLKDAGDPAELARFYSREGADELIFLDIAASVESRGIMEDVVRRTARNVSIPFTVGGGLSSVEDIRRILQAGADKVSLSTAAFKNPQLVREVSQEFGNKCLVVAIDARRVGPGRWEVYISGGKEPTGKDVLEWASTAERLGAGEILLTSMDRDGTKDGYDLELTRTVGRLLRIPVIASGGAGTLQHLYEGLTEGEADAVLAASIFHYREYSIREAKEYLKQRGVSVRL